jgi:hypothetical protein
MREKNEAIDIGVDWTGMTDLSDAAMKIPRREDSEL